MKFDVFIRIDSCIKNINNRRTMQNNLLGNFLLFCTKVSPDDWFRILPHLQTMPLSNMPQVHFKHNQYKVARQVKAKQKNQQQ